VGSTRGVEVIDRIIAGTDVVGNLDTLRTLCDAMTKGSLCALGGMVAQPVLSAVDHFSRDFGPRDNRGSGAGYERDGA
jgi:formate dehydrogenase iron-sulfur subunit